MKRIVRIFIILLTFIIFNYKVDAIEKVLLENNNSFGEIINNYKVSDKLLLKNGNNIEELDLITKERKVIHVFDTEINDTFMELSNNTIYFYYTDSENTKVIKYDLNSNLESDIVELNTKDNLNEVKKLTDLKVDRNGIMYFNYSNNAFVSYDKNGNYIDSYDTGLNNYLMIASISYNNDKLYVCLPLNTNIKNSDAFIKIENGKFVDKELIGSYIDRGVIYTDDGKFAVSNLNGIYKNTNNELIYITDTSYVRNVAAGVKYNDNYIYIEGKDIYFRFNKETEVLDKVYKLNYNFSGITYLNFVVVNNVPNIIVYDTNNNYYLLVLEEQDIKKIIVDTHKTMDYTVDEIKTKYLNSLPTFDYSKNIYDKKPSYKNGSYISGKLKSAVVKDTLNQLNFYRWLYGINDVSINEEYMERSMAGAVIQKKQGKMTHTPSKPKDMSENYYKLAYAGVNAGVDYSGNVSYGTNVNNIPLNYILDVTNVQTNVGHRLSMLDIKSDKTSFGYLDPYSAMSMYTTQEDLGNNEIFYSWPNAGYFPINNIDTNMFWSVLLNDGYYFTDKLKITLIDSENKEYEVTGYGWKSTDIFFQLPKSFSKKIVNNKKFIIGEEVRVKITGIVDEDYNQYELNYPVHFINAKTGQYEKIKLIKPTFEIKKNEDYSLDITIVNYNEKQQYVLEKSTDNKKWTKVDKIDGDKINVKGLKFGQKTYFRIKMTIYDYKKYSDVSNIIIKPNKVSNLTVKSAGTNNVKLTYDKVSVTGYELYSSTDNKKWTKVTTITKSSTLEYNVKKLKANKTYYFKVRAYKTVSGKKVYGSYSDVVSTKTAPEKPSFKVSLKDYNAMNLTIGSVKGASTYEVQGSLDDKTYSLIENLPSSGILAQEELKLGLTYYYRLRSCNKLGNCSGWVSVNLKQTTKAPKLTLTTKSKKVTATLTSVNGAIGYQLHMATKKNGKYEMVKEFSSEDELLEYTMKTKKGTTYYYKVRSFALNESEKRVYSPYSKVKSIKSK